MDFQHNQASLRLTTPPSQDTQTAGVGVYLLSVGTECEREMSIPISIQCIDSGASGREDVKVQALLGHFDYS